MTTANLAAALAKFQAEMPVVPKSSRANAGTYSYTYAGLADISALAMPLLSKHGLAFSACPAAGERGFVLTGVLLHESGERLEGTLPISGSKPQEIGSSLTYARRYLFTCMTGLVTDDDDDGQLAQRAERTRLTHDDPPPPPTDAEPWPEAVSVSVAAVTKPMEAKSRAAMFAEFARVGIPEAQQLAGINAITGKAYTSRGDLTDADARAVIADLKKRPTKQQEVTA